MLCAKTLTTRFGLAILAFFLSSCAPVPTPPSSVTAAAFSAPTSLPTVLSSPTLTYPNPTACLGSIAGKVYNDANRNLRSDPGETGLANAKIELENSSDEVIQTILTQAGDFTFTGLLPGGYSIRETPPDKFVVAGESTFYLTVNCGSTAIHNFLNVPSDVVRPEVTPAPQATATPHNAYSPGISWVVPGPPVTALYANSTGDIYYGSPSSLDGVGDPFLGNFALWEKPANGAPIQLTTFSRNLIGGIAVYNGNIYFNEAGALDRIPDDKQMHQQVDTVLVFPTLSHIYGHLNHALALSSRNGEPILLIAVGSRIDSNYDDVGRVNGIQPPYYEDFPTGRILFANLPWLETTHNYAVMPDGTGQVYEYARGVRNPWGMTVGEIGGRTHIFAVDNDPAFRPEKYDNDPQNAGDELNDIVFGADYGHPYYYAGEEPPPYRKPIAVFFDGSVPSGVAIAGGRLFVSLYQTRMITEIDPTNPDYKHSWKPVLTDVGAFNLASHGNALYIASWRGIRVIDVDSLK